MTFKVGDKVRLNERGKRQGYVSVVPKVVYEVTSVTTRKEITLKGVYAQWAVENWELVEDKMKYKVGDKVRIVANHSCHGFDDGDIVVIGSGDFHQGYRAYLFQNPSEEWYVGAGDIEPFITLPEQQPKSPMEFVDKYYENLVKDVMNTKNDQQITKDDPVESPSHYSSDKIECVDYLKDNMPFEAYIGGLEWNVKKYLHRWRRKGKPVEDLLKAKWYLTRLINELQGDIDA